MSPTNSDRSHVLPQCLGNASQQVLPPGIVCKSCNNYFGGKLEPHFLRFPSVELAAALLGVVDPQDGKPFREKVFGQVTLPAQPITTAEAVITTSPLGMIFELQQPVSFRYERRFDRRALQFLSRAVHKIAFEAVAWQIYVAGHASPVNPLEPMFQPVRDWVRRGQPITPVRPWLWRPPRRRLNPEWKVRIALGTAAMLTELDAFGDHFAAELTRQPSDLPAVFREATDSEALYLINESLRPLHAPPHAPGDVRWVQGVGPPRRKP